MQRLKPDTEHPSSYQQTAKTLTKKTGFKPTALLKNTQEEAQKKSV